MTAIRPLPAALARRIARLSLILLVLIPLMGGQRPVAARLDPVQSSAPAAFPSDWCHPFPRGAAGRPAAAGSASATPALYVKSSNPNGYDRFGESLAVDGDTMVIGAPWEASKAKGVNGDQTDNSSNKAGAVYVFVRSGESWIQQAYLKASNTETEDQFGFAVAIDGDTIVVGALYEDSAATGVNGPQDDNNAKQAGAAYVFVRNNGAWTQQAYLKASNTNGEDFFGGSVAIAGNTIVVGAFGEASNATGVNGNQASNTAPSAGAAYVFVRNQTTWSQQAYLKASNAGGGEGFGRSLAVQGDTVAVGAHGEDSAVTEGDNGMGNAGAVYVFQRSLVQGQPQWSQQAYLKAAVPGHDSFGGSVALDGETLVVGAYDEWSAATGVNGNQNDDSALSAGAAYVFVRSGTSWSQQAYLKASNTDKEDHFGMAVAIDGDRVVVGAYDEDSAATGVSAPGGDNSALSAGAAYLFNRHGTVWSQPTTIKASNTDGADYFGYAVAIAGDTVVVGAYCEASAAPGIGANQADNSAPGAGAVYVMDLPELKIYMPRIQAVR
ncbi:MAG TPA: FG-GAP repeat protein [Herpetosiphonaceae bacterium]|nr:FG-GAP repeat protein [Herpetosiphonaceae bacterium]